MVTLIYAPSLVKAWLSEHERSGNSTDGWNVTGTISFMNQPLLAMAGEIDTPVLLVHGEKVHSRYFSEGAYAQLKGNNKELMIIPGANHVDLYDNREAIPFDKLESFFGKNL
ncbi:MAG: alpha/beta hydrolase [Coriobacteriales bacterium]